MYVNGALYGTTRNGGTIGLGTIFKIVGKKETPLYSFKGGNDGQTPDSGLIYEHGTFYGTTNVGVGTADAGTVYSLRGSTETVLHSFGTSPDGSEPIRTLNRHRRQFLRYDDKWRHTWGGNGL